MNPSATGQDRPISSVERVYRDIRSAIIAGRHLPGTPLRLQELTEAYGVSLIPIREALRRLEVERLVENRPNRGARVAPISLADVADAYETRILLESMALRRAWPSLDADALAAARHTLSSMFEAFNDDRLMDGAELHQRHHFDLWARAGSDWLDHLIGILWSHTERYRNLALAIKTPTPGDHEHHLCVLEAIERGNLGAAIRHTEEELGQAKLVVLQHLSGHAALEELSVESA